MATFTLRADEITGETGLTLFLYPPGSTVANGAGDTLTESSGLFTATVAESLTGWHDYFIYQSGVSIYRGRVYCEGTTWIADQADPAIASIGTQLVDVLSLVEGIAVTGSPAWNAPVSSTLTTGTLSSGTFADVATANGTSHVHTDSGGALSVIYDYTLGASQVGVEVLFRGRINSANDSIAVQAYDWVGLTWDTLWTQVGVGGTVNTDRAEPILIKHTGTGANDGKVRIRFHAASGLTSATLYVDQLLTAVTAVGHLTAPELRTALGMAAADLDTQLDAIAAGGITAAGIRSAIGMTAADLDTQLDFLETMLRETEATADTDSATIKLKVGSTKTKTHIVTGNLTGKTLKLYIDSVPMVFFAEITATGGDGFFTFVPSVALTANVRTFPASLREPSDGNNPIWTGQIEVAYAADAE